MQRWWHLEEVGASQVGGAMPLKDFSSFFCVLFVHHEVSNFLIMIPPLTTVPEIMKLNPHELKPLKS